MKKKSKVVSGLMMGALMLVSFGGGLTYAAGKTYTQNDGNSASTTVTYEQADSTYTVSIPQSITLDEVEDSEETIEVTSDVTTIRNGFNLNISINTDDPGVDIENSRVELNSSEMNAEGTPKYTIYSEMSVDGVSDIFEEPLLSVTRSSTAEQKSMKLKFGAPVNSDPGVAIPADTYTGTLNFIISCDYLN